MAVLMVLSLVPLNGLEVYATQTAGADLSISTAADLQAFAAEVNAGNSYEGKLVVLANDIEMMDAEGIVATMTPIGTKDSPFKGTFDGQNHTISDLYITYYDTDEVFTQSYVGLFGVINTPAVIKNVTVHNPYMIGKSYVGAIVGMAYTGNIENCHVTGEIDIEGYYMVGGITGHGYARIKDCSVIGAEDWGYNTIAGIYHESNLEGDNVGGIVGHNAENNSISGCTVKNVDITGTRKIGGVVGITAQSTDITDCVVSNVTVGTTAVEAYAADNAKTMSMGGIVGQYMENKNGVGGSMTNCAVNGLTFTNENNVTISAGALTGGVRGTSADGKTVAPTEGNIAVSGNAASSVTGSTVGYLEPAAPSYPAMIGQQGYETLEAAFAAAVEGDTITLKADAAPALTSQRKITKAAVIDLGGKTLTLTEDDLYFGTTTFKNGNIVVDPSVKPSTAVFWMFANQTLTFDDVKITATGVAGTYLIGLDGDNADLNLLNGSELLVDNETALDLDIICVNASTGNDIVIDNSKVIVNNLDGRVFFRGNYTVSGSSDIDLSGITKAGFRIEKGQSLTISDTATVDITGEPRDGGIHLTDVTATYTKADTATVNAIVNAPKPAPAGTITYGFTSQTGIWGETTNNASESMVVELYYGDTKIATTQLNNIGGIIDGDVYVTWQMPFAGSTDAYWTVQWAEGYPNADAQPTKVVLVVDGVKVAENDVQMNGPDDLNKVVWEELEIFNKGLSGEGTQEDPFLINDLDDLIWFRDQVDEQASDGSTQFAGKYFKLTADIDLAGINWNPIGSMTGDHGSFKGVFDGDGHTISNLNCQQTGNGLGLFARTAGNAQIKNLTLHNVTVKSLDNSNYVGGVVGNSYASTKITNVHVTGAIDISGRGYIGGISGHGYVVMDTVSVIGEGTISSTFWCVGGVLGYGGEGATNITNAKVEGTGESGLTITSAAGGLGAIVGMAEDNNGTQPISGANLSAKNIKIKTYTGAYGDAYANYALGYLYGGNPTSKLTGNLSVENVEIITSSGETPEVNDAVADVDGEIYFDLRDAMAAADGKTVTVLRDVELTEAVTIAAGKTVTLDLNGKTISQSKACTENYNMILNKGNLTVTGNGTISFTDTGAGDPNFGWGSYTLRNEGTLVVENGTIEHLGAQNGNGSVKHMYCAIFQYSGSATINGGTISTPTYRSVRLWKGDMTINGGEFEGQVWVQSVDESAKLTVTGGTFAPRGVDGSSLFIGNVDNQGKLHAVDLAVTGGTFTTKIGANNPEAVKGAITGGTFSASAKDNTSSALIAAGMVFGEADDDGNYQLIDDPKTHYITNLAQLKAFRDDVNNGNTYKGVTVYLAADIDLAGEEWTPIGTKEKSFQGTFDGQDHTVSNLKIDNAALDYAGLFGYATNGAKINNVKIRNVDIHAQSHVGAVAGIVYTGSVSNCHVSGAIKLVADYAYAGGITGYGYVTVSDSSVIAEGTGIITVVEKTGAGGITGWRGEGNTGIYNCTVKNLEITAWANVGGITGFVHYNNTIDGCTVDNVKLTKTRENGQASIGIAAGGWSNEKNDNYAITITNNSFNNISINGTAINSVKQLYGSNYSYYDKEIKLVENGNTYGSITDNFKVVARTEADLEKALAYADSGETITLLDNIAIDTKTYTIADGRSLTLDMNGKTITVTDNKTSGNYELFYIYGELTVTGNGTIELTSTTDRDWNAMSAIFHNRGGVLTIENGTFTNLGGTDMAWVVDNSGNYYGDATTNILGGALTSTYTAIRNRMEQNSHGASGTAILNVSGGTIDGTTSAIWAQAASTSATAPATGEINISGGDIGLINTARSSGAECMTTISGGTVAGFKGEAGELTVTGGAVEQVEIYTAANVPTEYVVTDSGLYIAAAAKVGDTNYATLAEAVAAATDGATVTLLADIAMTERINVKAGEKLVLDLNGYVIDGVDNVNIAIMSYGDLTVKDTSAEQTGAVRAGNTATKGGNTINICAGTFTLESGSIYSVNNALLIDEQAATVTINGGNITADPATNNSAAMYISSPENTVVTINGGNMVGFNGILLWNKTSITMTAGSIDAQGRLGIQGNGSKDETEINISGGTVSGAAAAIYHPQGGKLNISGNAVLTGNTGVVVKGGNVTVSGGTISATGAAGAYVPVGSGFELTGDGLYVEHFDNSANSASYGTPVVTVTGGTITSANGKAVASYANPNNDVQALTGFISGGNFSDAVPAELCAEGYICVDNGDGTYGVKVGLPKVQITDIKKDLTGEDPDLTFALNFAIPNVEDLSEDYLNALFEAYGDYYVDYVLTIDGLNGDSVTFNANGDADGYLAGQYDAWSENWVAVPFSDVVVGDSESLYIMEYAAKLMNKQGLRFTLAEVAAIVQNFDCGVYFTPEFLAAHPDLDVSLQLKVFTEDMEGNKIENIDVATNEFNNNYAAAVSGEGKQTVYYATFAEAYAAAQAGDTVELLADAKLTGKLTVAKAITIDGNGCSIIADETAVWYTVSGKLNIKSYETHLLGINADGIVLKDVVLDCNDNAAGINVYCAQNVVFDNVQIINATKGFAGLTVNGSTLTARNALTISGNSVAIDISNGSGVTSALGMTFEDATVTDLGHKTVKFASAANNDMTGAVNGDGTPYFAAMDAAYYYTQTQIDSRTTGYSNGLTLLTDVTLNKDVTIGAALDLNGHTLTVADGKALKVEKQLTVIGEGSIVGNVALAKETATLTVPAGMENVVSGVEGYKVIYRDGVYMLVMENAVAWNMQTGVYYETVEEAMRAAKENQTVQMLADSDETDALISIRNKRTLDLNGFTLIAEEVMTSSVGAHIQDSANGAGLLKVGREYLTLVSNQQIMTWIEEDGGYRFNDVTYTQKVVDKGNGSAQFRFYLNGEDPDYVVAKELADGNGDMDGLLLGVRMTYKNSQGTYTTLNFEFPSGDIVDYGSQWPNKYLWMNISGLDTVSEVTFAAVLSNGTVEIVGAAQSY